MSRRKRTPQEWDVYAETRDEAISTAIKEVAERGIDAGRATNAYFVQRRIGRLPPVVRVRFEGVVDRHLAGKLRREREARAARKVAP